MNKKGLIVPMALSQFLFFFTCPVHANEVNPITSKRQETMISVLKQTFKQDLSDLMYSTTKNDVHIFENDEYTIEVKEDINCQATIYEKNLNTHLKDLGFPSYSIETIDFNINDFDTVSPVIEVEDVLEVNVNEEINFDEKITVSDNQDQDLDYSITGDIDYSKEGIYPIEISCTDKSGNETKKSVNIKVSDSNFYQKIADAALAQIGVNQDCTMLVTNALKAVGINFHGAPYEYASLGEWTDTPVPGDICIYSGHVALYVGNGQAVHGGWNGYTTILYSVSCSSPFIGYIHVNH
ncbi:NlpC/P60 family protein [Floccifex sp.]|uniref:NlpC/P60 family protein n=1 Tax=Floccifex sp. TaxID=2815810 RepID=UPI003F016CF4